MGDDTELSRDEVRRIAEAYLKETTVPRTTGDVQKVVPWDEIEWRRPALYRTGGDPLSSYWVVYLEQEGIALRSSMIMLIHGETGGIEYVGSANDEG